MAPSSRLQFARLGLVSLCLFALGAQAADLNSGEALHDQECISCHARLMQSDPDDIYRRSNRFVTSRSQLVAQVARCEIAAEAKWFDDQRADVVEYLNQTFYRFP